MKIYSNQYKEAYECGRAVHENRMTITQARQHLTGQGFNPNSAMDYVYGLRSMLKGQRYERTLNAAATGDYLFWIGRDYGARALKNAVSALRQHIEYYQSLTKSPMKGHVAVLVKYSSVMDEEAGTFSSPEEVGAAEQLFEGAVKTVRVNVYERNPAARKECLDYFGYTCSVCSFNFEKVFGAIGKQFIHVHHLLDLAEIGKEYTVDPKKDLRPVCPNCHAMLHKSTPAYPIEELKKVMAAQKE